MRILFAALALCGAMTSASSEETYERTIKLLGTCLGEHARPFLASGKRFRAAELSAFLEKQCGQLELRLEKEFFDFMQKKIFSKMSATDQEALADALQIEANSASIVPHGKMRRDLVNSLVQGGLGGKD